jgi:hypothetical protein
MYTHTLPQSCVLSAKPRSPTLLGSGSGHYTGSFSSYVSSNSTVIQVPHRHPATSSATPSSPPETDATFTTSSPSTLHIPSNLHIPSTLYYIIIVRVTLYIGVVFQNNGRERDKGMGSYGVTNNGCPASLRWRCTTNNNKLEVRWRSPRTRPTERHVISNNQFHYQFRIGILRSTLERTMKPHR